MPSRTDEHRPQEPGASASSPNTLDSPACSAHPSLPSSHVARQRCVQCRRGSVHACKLFIQSHSFSVTLPCFTLPTLPAARSGTSNAVHKLCHETASAHANECARVYARGVCGVVQCAGVRARVCVHAYGVREGKEVAPPVTPSRPKALGSHTSRAHLLVEMARAWCGTMCARVCRCSTPSNGAAVDSLCTRPLVPPVPLPHSHAQVARRHGLPSTFCTTRADSLRDAATRVTHELGAVGDPDSPSTCVAASDAGPIRWAACSGRK